MFSKKNSRNMNMNQNPYGTYYEQTPPGQYGDTYQMPPGQNQNPGFMNPNQNMMNPNAMNQSSLYPGFQTERLQHEIRENRRRINNLAKRIVRIENYLRIRDNSDDPLIDDHDVDF